MNENDNVESQVMLFKEKEELICEELIYYGTEEPYRIIINWTPSSLGDINIISTGA